MLRNRKKKFKILGRERRLNFSPMCRAAQFEVGAYWRYRALVGPVLAVTRGFISWRLGTKMTSVELSHVSVPGRSASFLGVRSFLGPGTTPLQDCRAFLLEHHAHRSRFPTSQSGSEVYPGWLGLVLPPALF